jgi:hypothetical protein
MDGKGDGLLHDELAGIPLERRARLGEPALGGQRAHHHAEAAGPGARLDDVPAQVGERPPRVHLRHRAQQRLGPAGPADEVLDVRVHALVVGHAGAERVDHRHRPRQQRGQQELAEVGEPPGVVAQALLARAPEDHVHAAPVPRRTLSPGP